MSNQINEVNDIEPYLQSFSFFSNNDSLKAKYNEIYKQDPNKIELSNFIDEIKNNDILQNNKLKNNPQKLFDYFLGELHKKFKNIDDEEEEKENLNKGAEINKENAFLLFKNFMDNDKSFISENFFGIKLITKTCQVCNISQYLFKYMKSIKINIVDIDEENELDLEKIFKKMTNSKANKNDFCPICSSNQNLEISFEITKCPKIIIFILPEDKNLKFKIQKNIGKEKYHLIAAETKKRKSIFDIFKIICSKNKKYRLIQGNRINEDIFSEEIPLVLFYQKKEDKLNPDSNKIMGLKDSFFSNREEEIKENNDYTNSEDKKLDIKFKDECLIDISQKDEKSTNNEEKKITLYFKIGKEGEEGKGMYIDTSDNNTFLNMIKELPNRYELEEQIDENKLFFNDINIDPTKTPKDYKMPNGSHIYIIN